MSKLEQKAKSLQQWMDEVTYIRQGKLLVPENPEQVKQRLVSFEVAEQEIDKEKEIYHVLWEKYDNLNELFQSLTTLACDYYDDTERERGLQKQKLREFWKWLEQKAWRGVSSEVIDEFGERFEELLK